MQVYYLFCGLQKKKYQMKLFILYCNRQILSVMPFKIEVSSGFKY